MILSFVQLAGLPPGLENGKAFSSHFQGKVREFESGKSQEILPKILDKYEKY